MIEILGEPRQPLDGRRQTVLREPYLVRDSGIPGPVPASGSQAGYRVPESRPDTPLIPCLSAMISYIDSVSIISQHVPRPVKL